MQNICVDLKCAFARGASLAQDHGTKSRDRSGRKEVSGEASEARSRNEAGPRVVSGKEWKHVANTGNTGWPREKLPVARRYAVSIQSNGGSHSGKIRGMKRRRLIQSISAAAFVSPSLWAGARQGGEKSGATSTTVYELRIYHAAPGKLVDLLARFREHTIKLFDRHGMKSVAYWTPVDEPEKSNTLIYILQHPSREAAETNWKAFRDDPEWKGVKEKSEENGSLVEKVDSTFMELTTFSPRLR
jgi:hypothetical protein